MNKRIISILLICFSFISGAQIAILGHNMINNQPITSTNIFVRSEGVLTKTLSTQSRADFKLHFNFGKTYQIYFQNAKSPLMFMEVDGSNVPRDKYEYLMTYEMNVPFVYKIDEDIDTTAFAKPFHRIIYNGRTKMVEDTVHNNAFNKSILKKHNTEVAGNGAEKSIVTLAGQVLRDDQSRTNLENMPITLYGLGGQILKTGLTNRFGIFVFRGIDFTQLGKIEAVGKDTSGKSELVLQTAKGVPLGGGSKNQNKFEWSGDKDFFKQLVDNHYTSNIGGKLVSSSAREKKFFADKDVYLMNRLHTVVQKTRTNLFGTFVFEDIKPDQTYYIGIDKNEVSAGVRIDLLSKEDHFITSLDSMAGGKRSMNLVSHYSPKFNKLTIAEDEMKMDVKATIFGDNVNNPIGKLKIILLNDNYQVIDSAVTDNFGTFKFKYLPFLKRFYLSAENTDNILDVFKNILIYSSDANLIKIMTHQKGTKFTYKPVHTEMSVLRDIELEDPWLELIDENKQKERDINPSFASKTEFLASGKGPRKLIVENILFENNRVEITLQAREVLDKVILVLNHNKTMKIEVGAHTDSKGSAAANLKLSEQRARIVQEYIIAAGVNASRVISKGYGESKLMNNCDDSRECDEAEHAKNRRIEFKILGDQANQ